MAQIAPFMCETGGHVPAVDWGIGNEQLNCVRKCLVREDKKAHDKEGASCGEGCLKDDVINRYHAICYRECRIPQWLFPGVNQRWLPWNPNKQN